MKKFIFYFFSCLLVISCKTATDSNSLAKKDLNPLYRQAVQGEWINYSDNPVLTLDEGTWDGGALGSMTVLVVDDTLHLYYEAWGVRGDAWSHSDYASLQIGHARSIDGIHWTKDKNNPVILKGEEGSFDYNGTWDPFVLYEDGMYKMWYGGGVRPNELGYAVSKDGSHFTKVKQISNDLKAVEDLHIVHHQNKYFMYYWHRAAEGGAKLMLAESDNETDFDYANAEEIRINGESYPGRYKFTHVFVEGEKWYMFYSNFSPKTGCLDATVRMAISKNGHDWTSVRKDILKGMDGEVVKVADDLYLMYYGPQGYFDQADCDIRLAIYKGELIDYLK